MIMPIKYTDEMVAEALAMRAKGVKQAVIHHIYGKSIEMAIRRVRARAERIERPSPLHSGVAGDTRPTR